MDIHYTEYKTFVILIHIDTGSLFPTDLLSVLCDTFIHTISILYLQLTCNGKTVKSGNSAIPDSRMEHKKSKYLSFKLTYVSYAPRIR